ncbi:MAG TPA: ABC transporter permease [Ferruginibacter sp.]|nr:ABC transporter permease [Ferruginibacter sp.]
MFQNYIKLAWRNLKRNRSYAMINIAGLSLGIACSILIFALISYHLNFDRFHHNRDRIYRLVTEWHDFEVNYSGAVPAPLGKEVRTAYSFSEKTARVISYEGVLISVREKGTLQKFEEDNGVAYVEPTFFDILNFPLIKGNIKSALNDPNTAIITEKMAKKYFGHSDPIGKIITVDNKSNFTITGILKDIPTNTDLRQEIYLSYQNLKDKQAFLASDSSWAGVYSGSQCFTLLKPGVNVAEANRQLQTIVPKYFTGRDLKVWKFKLQPLSDIHFNIDFGADVNKKYLWAFFFIGLFLIITACVNFVNLATAQALNRSKEIGIRKVLGSMRSQLFWQFILETALITFLAVLLAYCFAVLALPSMNGLFKTAISLSIFTDWKLPLFITVISLLVIFFAGSYPGLVLARFQAIEALKSKLSQRHVGGISLRRLLVITQFAISQVLIIGTIVIAMQMKYSKNTELGFTKDAIVELPVPDNDKARMQTLVNRLRNVAGVGDISLCFQPPAANANNTSNITFDNRAETEPWGINIKSADDQYIKTFGLKIVAGRNFYPSDTAREFVVNELTTKKLNFRSANDIIGKTITINGIKAPVVGVVNDFYNYSFHSESTPICIMPDYSNYRNCAVKLTSPDIKHTLASLEKVWNAAYPEYLYSYRFVDEHIASFYEMDAVMLTLIEIFAMIAIFIGCLGLYGLVSFMAVRKTKEIGVRKVLGAGIGNILWMFGKEFTILLLIAFVISAPIAWMAMNHYLLDFNYRIEISAGIFVAAIGFTFVIALITVGYRSVKASFANPVTSLRSE